MQILLDTGVWWRWMTRKPLRDSLTAFLAGPDLQFHLCPLSVLEIAHKVKHGGLKAPEDADWQTQILHGFRLAPFTFEAAWLAGQWPWEHGDPIDRALAAVAATSGLTLIHSDARLKDLSGFPQRYFRSVRE